MKAKVVWYNEASGSGEAALDDGSVISIYERSFREALPKAGDVIAIAKSRQFPGLGLYASSAKVLRAVAKKARAAKAA
jgi:hypothetical protein